MYFDIINAFLLLLIYFFSPWESVFALIDDSLFKINCRSSCESFMAEFIMVSAKNHDKCRWKRQVDAGKIMQVGRNNAPHLSVSFPSLRHLICQYFPRDAPPPGISALCKTTRNVLFSEVYIYLPSNLSENILFLKKKKNVILTFILKLHLKLKFIPRDSCALKAFSMSLKSWWRFPFSPISY